MNLSSQLNFNFRIIFGATLFVLANLFTSSSAKAQTCNCNDYLYVNDPTLDVTHKFIINPDGSVGNEIYSSGTDPWLPANTITNPHGVVADAQGNLYISQIDTDPTTLYKVSCDGTVQSTDYIPNWDRTLNLESIGTTIYSIGRDPVGGDYYLYSHDLCTQSDVDSIPLPTTDSGVTFGWGLTLGLDGELYFSQTFGGSTDDHCVYHVDPTLTTITQEFCIPNVANHGTYGIAQDECGNFYVVVTDTNLGSTTIFKVDSGGTVIDSITDTATDGSGFAGAWGIQYDQTSGKLYVGTLGDDCVAVIDAGGCTGNLTYEPTSGVGHVPGTYSKALDITRECCLAGSTIIDTAFCNSTSGDQIVLSDLICSEGPICGAQWTSLGDPNDLAIDNCTQVATVNVTEGCLSFVFKATGSSACSEDSILVNIEFGNISAAVLAGDISICEGEDPAAITVDTPPTGSSDLEYQWQQSTIDCNSGFVDISGASTITYDPPILSNTTYFRLISNTLDCDMTGVGCIDTSNCVTVFVNENPTCTALQTTAPTCNQSNGTATATASGGTAGYTYLWDAAAGSQTTAAATNLSAGTYTVTVTDANGCTTTCSVTLIDGGSPTCTATETTAPTCNQSNGTATATASGGTAGYTYLWDSAAGSQTTAAATNLAAGTYTVTVSDANGCTTTCSVTLIDGGSPTCTATETTAPTCNQSNGTATATASGGTAGYTYLWDSAAGSQTTAAAINLSAGTYTVTVTDANGCTTTCSATLTDGGSPTCTAAEASPEDCGQMNGSATVTPAGGTAGYTYLWDDASAQTTATATGLGAGTYNVIVTDSNGCTTTCSATVTSTDGPTCTAGESSPEVCGQMNGSVTVTPIGGTAGYTYLWDDASAQTTATATGLAAGTYNVIVTDVNGCTTTCSATVTSTNGPTCTAVEASPEDCGQKNGSATVTPTGGTAGYTYLWDDANAQTTATATGLAAGTYNVIVTDANGCTTTCSATVTSTNGPTCTAAEASPEDCGQMNGSATVTPTGGTAGYTYLWDDANAQTTATATGLATGTYNVIVTDANGCTTTCSATVTTTDGPICTAAEASPEDCGQMNGSATVTPSGGTAGYTYLWDDASAQTTATATGLGAGTYNVIVTDANGCTTTCSATVTSTNGPTCTAAESSAEDCGQMNGSATVTPSGGTAGYTYLWDDANAQTTATATGLAAGTYNVIVTDANGCTTTCSATVTSTNGPTCTAAEASPEDCGQMNGSATVTPTGGTAGYTYLWDDANAQTTATATGLAAGTYTVIVTDANNCTTSCSVTVTEESCIYDLALTKVMTSAGPYAPGDVVSFDICVVNQGEVAANNIEVTDYIPAGMSFSASADFSATAPHVATIASIAVGATECVSIDLQIDATYTGSSLTNDAEITADDGDDVDSTPADDGTPDDTANNDDTADSAGGDDQDPEVVPVVQPEPVYDLALTKVMTSAGPYAPGDVVSFDICVVNQGEVAANNIEVTDYIPAGMSFSASADFSATAPHVATIASIAVGATECVSIDLQIDATYTGTSLINDAEITADDGDDVDSTPADDGTPDDTANDDDTADTAGGDDQDPVVVPVVQPNPVYDLALTKVMTSAGPYAPGDVVIFDICVVNQGEVAANNIEVTDYIPAGMSFSASADFSATAPHVATIASIAVGATECVSIDLQIDATYTGTSLTNDAEITADDGDDVDSTPADDGTPDDTANNDDTADTAGGDDQDPEVVPVVQPNPVYDLALTKVMTSAGPYAPGDVVSFDICVVNQGEVAANNIEVTDYIPAGMSFSASADFSATAPHVATIASIAVGATECVSIDLQIDATYTGTSLTNDAEITADDGDDVDSTPADDGTPDDTANNDDTADTTGGDDQDPEVVPVVQPEPVYDLALTKVMTSAGPYAPGDVVSFDICVVNQGDVAANNIEVTDYIPTGMTFSASADFSATAPHVATIASIAVGATECVSIDLQIDATFTGTSLTNDAEITADDGDDVDSTPADDATPDDTANNDDTADTAGGDDQDPVVVPVVQPNPVYDLALTKVMTSAGPYAPGDVVSFDICVVNQGDVAANNIEVTDYIPAGMSFSASADFSATAPHVATIASIAVGATECVSIDLQIDATFTGTSLTNDAEITADDGDDVDSTPADDGTPDDTANNDDTADTTGGDDQDPEVVPVVQPQPLYDLALTKMMTSAGPYAPGDVVSFDICVVNQGDIAANNVEVTDYIPAGMTFSASVDFSATAPHIATISSIAVGGTECVSIDLQIDATFTGTSLTNDAEITADDGDDVDSTPADDGTPDDTANNDDTADTAGGDDQDPEVVPVVQPNPVYDLALTKVMTSAGPYAPGDVVSFDICVVNQGDIAANNVEVTDYIPAGMSFSSSAEFSATAPHVATIANIAVGATECVSIDLQIDATYTGTSLTNDAEITADDGDDVDSTPADDGTPDDTANDDDTSDISGGDDQDPAVVPVVQPEPLYDLALTKVVTSVGPYAPGDIVSYDICVINQGEVAASGIEVTDYIPSGMTFSSSADFILVGADYVATIASIAVGATECVSLDIQIDASFAGTSLINDAEITADDGDDADSTPADDSTPDDTTNDDDTADTNGGDDQDPALVPVVQPEPVYDLALTKVMTSAGPYAPGDVVSFDICVVNQGDVAANNIEVTDYLPVGMTFSASADFSATAPHVATIASIAVGATECVSIDLQIDATFTGTSLTNDAEITADDGDDVDSTPADDGTPDDTTNDDDTADTNGGDDQDPAEVPVVQPDPVYDLALTKVMTSAGPYAPGDVVSFDICVVNQGEVAANNVEVTDYIPAGMTFSASADFSATAPHVATIASIAVGATECVSIDLQIDATFTGTSLTNDAEITADDGDDVDSTPADDGTPDDTANNDDTADNTGGDDQDPEVVAVVQPDPVYDLALTKIMTSAGPYAPGDVVSFDICVVNQGDIAANNIEVTDYIPAGMIYSASADFSATAPHVATIANIAVGATECVSIDLQIDATYTGTSLTNDAEITADDGDDVDSTPADDGTPDDTANDDDTSDISGGDDQDPAVVPVVQPEPLYDLALTKVVTSVGPYAPGDIVSYDICVINQGEVAASGIEVTDYIPSGMTFSSSADFILVGADYVATIASIAVGATECVSLDIQIDASFAGTSLINDAEITADDGDDADSTPADDSTPDDTTNDDDTADTNGGDDQDPALVPVVQPEPVYDLALTKVMTSAGPYAPGDVVSFDICVVNQGDVAANNIEVTDYLPVGMTFSASADFSATAPHVATIASIAVGATECVSIDLQIDATFTGTSLTNDAEITADDGDDVDSTPADDGTPDDTANNNDTADTTGGDDQDPEEVIVEQPVACESIGGEVFVDANDNGCQDSNETMMISGATVNLWLCDPATGAPSSVVTSTTTGTDGSYSFGGTDAGTGSCLLDPSATYTVEIVVPTGAGEAYEGYTFSSGTADGSCVPGEEDDVSAGTGIGETCYDPSDPGANNIDAGLVPPPSPCESVGGEVFVDANDNGCQDANETMMISGATVNLWLCDPATGAPSSVVTSTTTGTDGSYSFGGTDAGTGSCLLDPSATYTVEIIVPTGVGEAYEGYTFSSGTADGSCVPGEEDDVSAGTGIGETCYDPSDPGANNIDAGLVPPPSPCESIGGEVFVDANDNGCQDANETMMISGATVNLWVCDPATGAPSSVVTSTTTGTDGSYSFGGTDAATGACLLDPSATYTVEIVVPTGAGEAYEGYTFSSGTADGSCVPGEEDDVSAGTGIGETCYDPSDPGADNIDAGLVPPPSPCESIGGEVFVDANDNGCQDANETMMISGATVNLWVCDPATGAPSSVVTSTTTGTDGSYSFGGTDAGTGSCLLDPSATYTVEIVVPTGAGEAYEGYTFSSGTADGSCVPGGEDDVSAGTGIGETCYDPSDPGADNIDAGLVPPPSPCESIGGEVFVDANDNGCQDANETMMISGATVNLWLCDPATGAPSSVVTSTTTGTDGSYSFGGTDAGTGSCLLDPSATYTVEIIVPTGAGEAYEGYTFSSGTADGSCVPGEEDDVLAGTGIGETCYDPTGIDNDEHIDAGLVPPPAPCESIGGEIFVDANDNGCQDAGETTMVSGAEVTLWQCDPLTGSGVSVVTSTFTGGDGAYSFGGIDPSTGDCLLDVNQTYAVQIVPPTGVGEAFEGYTLSSGTADATCETSGESDDVDGTTGISACSNPSDPTSDHIDAGIVPPVLCTAPAAPALAVNNNVCPSTAGSFEILTDCGAGSTIEYSTDGGTSWTGTLPTWSDGISVIARCVDVTDATCVSNNSNAVTAQLQACCTQPGIPSVTVNNNVCPSTTGSFELLTDCGAGSTIEYSTDGGASWTGTLPTWSDGVTVIARCVDSADGNCFSGNSTPVTAQLQSCCVTPAAPALAVNNNVCPSVSGSFEILTDCGAGSTMEYSTDGGTTWGSALPAWSNGVTVIARCVDNTDATCISASSGPVTATLQDCCTAPAAPALAVNNNVCPSTAGSFEILTDCGAGSTIEFSADGGTSWTGTLPAWSDGITVIARCVDVTDATCVSNNSNAVTGQLQACCTQPGIPSVTVNNNVCPSTTGSFELLTDCGAGSTIEYSTDGGASWTGTLPTWSDGVTVIARCVDSTDGNCFSGNSAPVTAQLQSCCVTPTSPALAVNNNVCPSVTGSFEILTDCGAGSTIEYSTDGGTTWVTALPAWSNGVTVIARCVDNTDATCISASSGPVTATLQNCCTAPAAPALAVNNNVCPSTAGSFEILTDCGAGSTIEYSTDGGTSWTGTLPTWSDGITVIARCVDATDATCVSNNSNAVTGQLQACCTQPGIPSVTVNNNVCPSTTGSFELLTDCGVGSTIEYSTNGGASWTGTLPTWSDGVTVIARCVDSADGNCFSGNSTPVTAQLQSCCVTPASPALAVNNNVCPSVTGSFEILTDCGAGSTIEYSTNGGTTWVATLPAWSNGVTVIARCVDNTDATCVSQNSNTVTATIIACDFYDLSIDKVITSTGPYQLGSTITYAITISNDGTIDANNVQFTDVPSTGLNYISSDAAGNANVNELAGIVFEVVSLTAGSTETINLTFTIDNSFAGGTLTNGAEITLDDGDDIDSNPAIGIGGDDIGNGAIANDDEATTVISLNSPCGLPNCFNITIGNN